MFSMLKRITRNNIYFGKRTIFDIKEISYEELNYKLKEGAILIDVRTIQEFKERHIDGAIVIPYYEITKEIEQKVADKTSEIIVYCQNGGRGKKAIKFLYKLGYENVYNLKGGIESIL